MDNVAVVVPTYNEADNLPELVQRLLALDIPHLELIVVDDNSADGTGEVAERLAEQFPGCIKVVHREAKLGLGTAYKDAYHLALQNGAHYVVQMDADLSHSQSTFPPSSTS